MVLASQENAIGEWKHFTNLQVSPNPFLEELPGIFHKLVELYRKLPYLEKIATRGCHASQQELKLHLWAPALQLQTDTMVRDEALYSVP